MAKKPAEECTCPMGVWLGKDELCDYCREEQEQEARAADKAALQSLTNFIVRGNG